MKKAIVLLADGFEDVEAITPIDYLRRAGIDVTVASISKKHKVEGRWSGIKVIAGATLAELISINKDLKHWDAVIIPGGIPGATNLAESQDVCTLLNEMAITGKLICAICASPAVVLAPLGLLAGKKFTCYPKMEERVKDGEWSEDRVVVDGNIITSRGAGTAGEFAIAIIEKLLGEAAAKKIADAVLL